MKQVVMASYHPVDGLQTLVESTEAQAFSELAWQIRNKWLGELSPEAQIQFLTILIDSTPRKAVEYFAVQAQAEGRVFEYRLVDLARVEREAPSILGTPAGR